MNGLIEVELVKLFFRFFCHFFVKGSVGERKDSFGSDIRYGCRFGHRELFYSFNLKL